MFTLDFPFRTWITVLPILAFIVGYKVPGTQVHDCLYVTLNKLVNGHSASKNTQNLTRLIASSTAER